MQVIAFMGESMLSNLSELLFSTPVRNFLQIVISNFSNTSVSLQRDSQDPQTSSGSLIVTIRRFTLSYLRCCALFKRLLFAPCLEETEEWGSIIDPAAKQKIIDRIDPDNDQDIDGSVQDLKELEMLEGELLIPSLQQLLESEDNQQLVLRWCQHFIKESVTRKLLPIPKPVMAVPFKLMDLPPLYQTLLQR
jgi:E3 ubiquitin-protein ligase UBR3